MKGASSNPIKAWEWAPLPTTSPIADKIRFDNTIPTLAQVSGQDGAVEANASVKIYSSATKDTVLGTATATATGSFTLTFNNSLLSLQTVYVTATATGKTESSATVLEAVIFDIVPPVNLSTNPADGATNVSVEQDAPIYVEFNEPVFPGTALRSVTIKDANNIPLVYVQAEIALWSNRYLQIHHSRFENNKTYTVTVPAQTVKDAAGNANASAITWSFTTMDIQQTAAPVADKLSFDNTVPEYAKVYGAYGAVEENATYPVVRIYSSAAKDTVLGTTTATSSGAFWLTFNNSSSLQTVYVTATAPWQAESAVTPLPVSIDDDTDLVVVSIEPVPYAEFVAVDAPIKVTFNKPILAGSEIGKIYINDHTEPGINYVGGSVNGNELLIPHSTFWNCWYHDVFVPVNAVTDTAGNPLVKPLMWTFSTECIFF